MKRRILVIASSEAIVPAELMVVESEIVLVNDRSLGIAQAVAMAPEFVVLPPGTESISLVQAVIERLIPERYPTFLIVGTTTNQRNADSSLIPLAAEQKQDQVRCHGLFLDRSKLFASIHEQDLTLTLMEFSILWHLALKPGHVRTRDDLVAACRRDRNVVGRRTIDQHIRSLRKKMGESGHLIETVRGMGYRFRDCNQPKIENGCLVC